MYWLFIIKVWWWWWWWWSPWSSLHWKTSFHAPVKLLSVGERILCLLTHQYVFSTVDTRDWYNFVFSISVDWRFRPCCSVWLFCLRHISHHLFCGQVSRLSFPGLLSSPLLLTLSAYFISIMSTSMYPRKKMSLVLVTVIIFKLSELSNQVIRVLC